MWENLIPPWRECLALSWDSFCEGSIPIGAVIWSPDGILLARGRNRIGGQATHDRREIVGGRLAHAELNALLDLENVASELNQLSLYSTVEPCPLCMGAICMAGIKRIHFAARDRWAGSTNLVHATPYLRRKQITAVGPDGGQLETLVQMLQVACEVHRRHPNFSKLLEVWRSERASDVALGEKLYASGLLKKLCDQNATIETVVKQLLALQNV